MLEMGERKYGTKEHIFQVVTFLLEKAILTNPTLLNTTCPCSTGLIWLSLSNPSVRESHENRGSSKWRNRKGKPQEVTLLSPCPTDEWVPRFSPLTILLTNCMIWRTAARPQSHQ